MTKVEKIYKKIADLRAQIVKIQDECEHTKVIKMPRANLDNYDPTQDRYWYDCVCKECDKRWEQDQ
jgi:hypothetical protein